MLYDYQGNGIKEGYPLNANYINKQYVKTLEDGNTKRYLIWNDEFETVELDESKWGHLTGLYRNRYYMLDDVSNNAYIEDSILHISCKRDNPTNDCEFSGAWIYSKESFKYGRIEAKIKYPDIDEYHATFWTFGANCPPEMFLEYCDADSGFPVTTGENDIAECDNRIVTHTMHRYIDGVHSSLGTQTLTENGTGWHIYACEWTEASMDYYLDGALIHSIDISAQDVFHIPHYLILNHNPYLDNPGLAIDESEVLVDWVRVYASRN